MQANTKWNSGNFTLTHSAEIPEAMIPAVLSIGILWLAQRNREHDVVLGAFEKVNGKNKRKAGFKRGDVAFTPALALALKAGYEDNFVVENGEAKLKLDVQTFVEEYVRDTAEAKFAFEREVATARESLPQAEFDKWLEGIRAYGEFADTHTADGEDYSKEFLLAIRNKINAIKRAV